MISNLPLLDICDMVHLYNLKMTESVRDKILFRRTTSAFLQVFFVEVELVSAQAPD